MTSSGRMIDYLTSQGWAVSLRVGQVYLAKGNVLANYATVRAAYVDRGGPTTTFQAPGKP